MENRILALKNDFNNIITIRSSVKNIFDILLIKIEKLKLFYLEFIKNKKDELFVFGLDTFHFQSKLIDIEYDGIKRIFLVINNRMYCEYFKLNKIMTDYILKNINDQKYIGMIKPENFPIYKDLEPFKEYDFNFVLEIHDNILNLFNILILLLNNKENDLSIHKTKQCSGLNIDNFVTAYSFHNIILRENIIMFITYIEFFHKLHTKYIKRLNDKIHHILSNINNDIRFDESEETNNYIKDEINEDLSNINNLDKEILSFIKIDKEKENIRIIINDDNDLKLSSKSRSNSITSEISISTTASNVNNIVNESNVSEDESEIIEDVKPPENDIVNIETEKDKKKRTYKPRKKKN
jgi:hypothetical protein